MELYCRYRNGKKAKPPVVARQRGVVEIDDGENVRFWSDDEVNAVDRTRISANGRARDYEVWSTRPQYNVPNWLSDVEDVVHEVFEQFS